MVTEFDHNLVVSENVELVNCQWSVVSGQWSVVSGHWSLVIGHWVILFFLTPASCLLPSAF